jgi:hypothetical protein
MEYLETTKSGVMLSYPYWGGLVCPGVHEALSNFRPHLVTRSHVKFVEASDTCCLLLEGFFVINFFVLYPSPKEVRSKRLCCGHVNLEPT